jgi:glucans biosynthesis protein C
MVTNAIPLTRPHTSAAVEGSAKYSRDRIHYLDWLRAIAVLVIVGFHAVLPFGKGLAPWYIQNAQTSEALATVDAVLMFVFPVFFLLAGASARLALDRRSIGAFLAERATRLAVPYVLGTGLLVLPTAYWLATYNGSTSGSFFEFVPQWAAARLDTVRAIGFTPQVFGVGDWLWFLAWLFIFALLASPVFVFLATRAGRRLVDALARLARWPGATILFVVPITLVALPLFRITPADQWMGWWAFGVYFPMFVIGYVIYCDQRLIAAVRRDLIPALLASTLALYGIAATGFTASIFAGGSHTSDLYYCFIVFLHALMGWAPALLLLSFGMRMPPFQRPLPTVIGESSLPTYVLHQPIVLVLSSLVVSWSLGFWPKAVINVGLGIALSLGAGVIATRISGVRALLGVHAGGHRTSSGANLSRKATAAKPGGHATGGGWWRPSSSR